MLAQIERYVKTALVDKDAYVSSSALVSSMHLTHSSAEVVRRWVDEVQNALNGKTHMVQYHALGVLHKIRQHDRLAVLKTITTLAKGTRHVTRVKHGLTFLFRQHYSLALRALLADPICDAVAAGGHGQGA